MRKTTNITLLIVMVMGLFPTPSAGAMSKSTSKLSNTRVVLVCCGAAAVTAITAYMVYRYLHRKKNSDVPSFPPVVPDVLDLPPVTIIKAPSTTDTSPSKQMTLADILPADSISKPDPVLSKEDSALMSQIFVKCTASDKTYIIIDVHQNYPIWYVKKLVAQKYIAGRFIPANTLYKIRLIYDGQILPDDKALKEYESDLKGKTFMAVIGPIYPPSAT